MEHNHSEDQISSQQKNTSDSVVKNEMKKYSLNRILHGAVFPWILVALLVLGIGVYSFYQTKHLDKYPYTSSQVYYYPHSWGNWHDWYVDNDRYWMDIEDRIRSLQNQHKSLLEEIQNNSQILPSNGHYQGTKIINNDVFSYSLDVNGKSLSGSMYTTKSGSLDDLVKKIQSLGIILKKTDNQYVFSGKIDNIQNILNILGE